MSEGPTFVFPPQIIDALVQGLHTMNDPPQFKVSRGALGRRVLEVRMVTDAGPITILRGQDMERT